MTLKKEFIEHQDALLNHLILGEVKRGKSFGIHFFQEELHRIEEITKHENPQGVWEAKVMMRHPKTKNWVGKAKASTFFPRTWSKELLIQKLEEAFDNQKRVSSYQALGQTSCGISINFFYKQGDMVGCFPIYDTNP